MLRQVETKNGVLRGLVGSDPRVTVFRGVPFAKPPIGELRWKAPQPADPWVGVKKCYEYGDIPMIYPHPGADLGEFYTKELNPTGTDWIMSEDCLYLNIFSTAETKDDKLPVFCYIHGGGYTAGYNYEAEFNGERLARQGCIVVFVSYRLGLFGFLGHPELTAEAGADGIVSNFGLQDQAFAIKWIYENIAAFGGDPSKITICGQSAGAGSVQYQLCAPQNKGLIAGAICQSGVSFGFAESFPDKRSMTVETAEKTGVDFFKAIGVKDLAEARALPAKELMARKVMADKKLGGRGYGFGPIIDGKFAVENVVSAYYNDRLPDVPMMVGHCWGESQRGGFFKSATPTYEEFVAQAEAVYGDKSGEFLALCDVHDDADVEKLYAGPEFNRLLSCSRGFCELRSEMGKKVYYFVFDHDLPGDDSGSFHGSEMWFMFDSLQNCWRPFEGKHYDLARQAASYWMNFVKYGDPNGEGVDYIGKPLPRWEAYKGGERKYMRFMDVATPSALDEDPIMDFRLEESKKIICD